MTLHWMGKKSHIIQQTMGYNLRSIKHFQHSTAKCTAIIKKMRGGARYIERERERERGKEWAGEKVCA